MSKHETFHILWAARDAYPSTYVEADLSLCVRGLADLGVRSTLLYDPNASRVSTEFLQQFDAAFPAVAPAEQASFIAPHVICVWGAQDAAAVESLNAIPIPLLLHRTLAELRPAPHTAIAVTSRHSARQLQSQGYDPNCIHVLPPAVDTPSADFEAPDTNPSLLIFSQDWPAEDLALVHQELCAARPAVQVTEAAYETSDAAYDAATAVVVACRDADAAQHAALRAMSRRRPVIGLGIDAHREWIDEGITGFAVPEYEVRAMARAAQELTGNAAQARQMGARAREFASTFSPRRRAEKLLSLLEALCGGEADGMSWRNEQTRYHVLDEPAVADTSNGAVSR